MNLDEVKNMWQQRNGELAGDRVDELAARVLAQMSTFSSKILRRDWIETAAAALVVLVFAFFLQVDGFPWISKLGMVVSIVGCLEVVAVLHWTRRRGGRPRYDLPLAEFCAAEVDRVDRQIWLLRNVSWWYTIPLLLGACIVVLGVLLAVPELPLYVSVPWFAVFLAVIVFCGWIIHSINQRAVRQTLPLREELAAIAASLSED
jgi:protein-S-isoprenylcysteine O-methyltransferase Ste14